MAQNPNEVEQAQEAVPVALVLNEQLTTAIGKYQKYVSEFAKVTVDTMQSNTVLARFGGDNAYNASVDTFTSERGKKTERKQINRERDAHGRTTAHYLAMMGNLEALKVEKGQRNSCLFDLDNNGLSVVHYLMFSPLTSEELFATIKELKLDITAQTAFGHTAQDVAIFIDNQAMAQATLATDKMFKTPKSKIHEMASKGATQSIEATLNMEIHGETPYNNPAYLNARDEAGNTMLHHAIKGHHVDTVQCLVDNGANLNAINKAGETPLSLAVRLAPEFAKQVAAADKQAEIQRKAEEAEAQRARQEESGNDDADEIADAAEEKETRVGFIRKNGLEIVDMLTKAQADRNFGFQGGVQRILDKKLRDPAHNLVAQRENSFRYKYVPHQHITKVQDAIDVDALWAETFAKKDAEAVVAEFEAPRVNADPPTSSDDDTGIEGDEQQEQAAAAEEQALSLYAQHAKAAANATHKEVQSTLRAQYKAAATVWSWIQQAKGHHDERIDQFLQQVNYCLKATDSMNAPVEQDGDQELSPAIVLQNEFRESPYKTLDTAVKATIKDVKFASLQQKTNMGGKTMGIFRHVQDQVRKCIETEAKVIGETGEEAYKR